MSATTPHRTRPKGSVWPWVLSGGLLVFGSLSVFVASFTVSALAASMENTRQESAVEQTVLDFDAAYAEQDCEAFRALVAEDLADQLVNDDFDCESWVAIAESLRLDGEYAYSVEVLRVEVDGDWAGAYTEELDAYSQTTNYYYELERSAGAWTIVSYTVR